MPNEIIAVGIDGSPRSHDALAFALTEAELRDASVLLVTSWPRADDLDGPRRAEEIQREALSAHPDPKQPISRQCSPGRPEDVLVRASEDAALVVLGSHGTESLRRSALGTVSEYVARMASCPVVVVPSPA